MSVPFLIAALLATVAFLGHGLGGELRKLKDLQGTSLPDTDKLELRAAWHVVTLTLLWSTRLDKIKNLYAEVPADPVGKGYLPQRTQAVAQPSNTTSACSRTVMVAFSCLSGG